MRHPLSLMLLICLLLLATIVLSPSEAANGGVNFKGRPKQFKAGMPATCAVWFAKDGSWNIAATCRKGKTNTFAGRVLIDGDSLIGQFGMLENGKGNRDAIIPHPNGRGFDFRFVVKGHVDGVRFKVGPRAKAIGLDMTLNGKKAPKSVILGAGGVHPPTLPLVLPPRG